MTFLGQIYFANKNLEFAPAELLAIQLYSCFDCCNNTVVEIDERAELNTEIQVEQQVDCRDIAWVKRIDPAPASEVDQFWDDGEILPDHEHLLCDKIGGCFPTVDHVERLRSNGGLLPS